MTEPTRSPHRRTIVVGLDSSPEAAAALRWVHAARPDDRVVAVRAWDVGTVLEDRVEARAADTAGPPAQSVRIERRVACAPAAVALVDASRDADLVVVGSRGRSALRGLLLGSTSAEVAARAESPVVVVRAPAKPTSTRPSTS